MLEGLIGRLVGKLLSQATPNGLATDVHWLGRLIRLGHQMDLGLSLERSQEVYYQYLHHQIFDQLQQAVRLGVPLHSDQRSRLQEILRLGHHLSMDVAKAQAILERI
ncbi:MAG: hypothetical protein LVS60_15080 [Nodosilinea sp. LVE1205-7]|jgi:hypothetical protein